MLVGRDVSAFHVLRTGREGVAAEWVGCRVDAAVREGSRRRRTGGRKEVIQQVDGIRDVWMEPVVVDIRSVIAGTDPSRKIEGVVE